MSSRTWIAAAAYAVSSVFLSGLLSAGPQSLTGAQPRAVQLDRVALQLQRVLSAGHSPPGDMRLDFSHLQTFYRNRDYQAAWHDTQGLNATAQLWLSALSDPVRQSKQGALLHYATLQKLLDAPQLSTHEHSQLELLLSDAFLRYVRLYSEPRLQMPQLHDKWFLPRPSIDPVRVLENALQPGQFARVMVALEPGHTGYRRLRERLAEYLQQQARGGWPPFALQGVSLKPGMVSEEIPLLRRLLTATGDRPGPDTDNNNYDAELERAVRRFQQRHGLLVDGIVGKATRAALAVPLSQRIAQLRINLERWRWLPEPGERYIMVNSAGFELQAHTNGRAPLSMRVIVGMPDRQTPVFTEHMSYLVVNPYWRVPSKLAKRDLIPSLLRDPGYFEHQGIRVLSDWKNDAVELDASQIAWRDYIGERYLPYQLRQDPGPHNSLGRIKFMLPNPHGVYLHDTPTRTLFDRPVRAFSAGCIRVEKPLALASFVLGDDSRTQHRLEALLASGATGTLPLAQPLPVFVLYHTAWVDEAGLLQFRDDIYRHDRKLLAALNTVSRPVQRVGKPPLSSVMSLLH